MQLIACIILWNSFFIGHDQYKIILEGYTDPGNRGKVTTVLKVNKPPKKGSCAVQPDKGVALETKFKVSCWGFKDEDQPLAYEFFFTKDDGKTNESLGYGLQSSRSPILLPNGLKEHDFEIKFSVKIFDNLGASTTFTKFSGVKVGITFCTITFYSVS